MGNGKSNLIQTGSTVSTRLFRSAKDDKDDIVKERSQFPDNLQDDVNVDEKLRKAWDKKQRSSSNRRRSVSVHVRSIRRQSSLMHENLVKINLLRKVRDVYSGLDSSGNQLGEGTWGQVFLVQRRDDPSKKAAIKILQLSESIDNARLNELRSEISLLQKIDHPHIAKLYETFEDDGLNLYLVMEYLAGGELFDRVIEQGHFSEPAAATAIKQMVGAIQYLHSRGIVHRDLKLENWVYRDKHGDQLVLIDFGLSCRYFDESNSEGHDYESETRNNRIINRNKLVKKYMREMVGSSYYMAPEVLKRKYGKECDLWSIGVIAYMLLSGHPPFAGDTDAQILRKVKTGTFDFNHSAFSKVSDNSKDFVSKLLVYNPSERMNAKDALKHLWLSDHHKKMMQRRSKRRGSVIDKAVVDNLKNFVNTNRFKKLALQAVAYSTGYDDIKELQQIFEDIDQDQDGYISFMELQAALKDNPHVDPKFVSKIFEAMDVNKMQKIHLNEFIAATMNHSLTKDENLLQEAFNRLDVNETGEISKEDLTELLGKNFDKQTIDQIFREFSADIRKAKSEKSKGDKFKTLTKVTKKDFIQAMRRARIQNTQSLLSLPSDDSDKLINGDNNDDDNENDKESVEEFEL